MDQRLLKAINTTSKSNGPMLQLISRALKLWIRLRCDSIGELKIELYGTLLNLIQGHLEGISLSAKDIIFQGLPLSSAKLKSGPLEIKLIPNNPIKAISLEDRFNIEGSIIMNEKALNHALSSSKFKWLGKWIAKKLMNLETFNGISFINNSLVFLDPLHPLRVLEERYFIVTATQGTVQITNHKNGRSSLLPMDPSIHIEEAKINGDQLTLKGIAIVQP